MRRLLLLSSMIALASVPALAEPTRDAVMDGAARCDGIADNRVWLDCFYGSAQPMRSLLNLPPANPAQVRLVPGANATQVTGLVRAAIKAAEHSRQQPATT